VTRKLSGVFDRVFAASVVTDDLGLRLKSMDGAENIYRCDNR
jgi:hypothetical protein